MWSWTHALSPCPCSGCPLGFMCVYAVVIHHLPVSINVHAHTHKITTKHSQSGSCPQYNFSLHHQRTQLIKNNPPLSRILSLETGCNPNSLSLASSPPLSHSLTLVLINQQTAQLLPAQPTSDGRRKSCQSPLSLSTAAVQANIRVHIMTRLIEFSLDSFCFLANLYFISD